jgi:hypothetical protein
VAFKIEKLEYGECGTGDKAHGDTSCITCEEVLLFLLFDKLSACTISLPPSTYY